MTYTESKMNLDLKNEMIQLTLPIECPECGDNRIVECFCDWKMALKIPKSRSPFRIIEKFLGVNKEPHDFERIEILPGIKAVQYKK